MILFGENTAQEDASVYIPLVSQMQVFRLVYPAGVLEGFTDSEMDEVLHNNSWGKWCCRAGS